MIAKYSLNDNISINQMIILQPPKVIATLTIMIIIAAIIITVRATKIRATAVIKIVSILQKSVSALFCFLNPPLYIIHLPIFCQ